MEPRAPRASPGLLARPAQPAALELLGLPAVQELLAQPEVLELPVLPVLPGQLVALEQLVPRARPGEPALPGPPGLLVALEQLAPRAGQELLAQPAALELPGQRDTLVRQVRQVRQVVPGQLVRPAPLDQLGHPEAPGPLGLPGQG